MLSHCALCCQADLLLPEGFLMPDACSFQQAARFLPDGWLPFTSLHSPQFDLLMPEGHLAASCILINPPLAPHSRRSSGR